MRGAEVVQRLRKRFIFFGRNSSVHGLHYVFEADRSLFCRIFWLLTLIACMGCLYVMMKHAGHYGVEVNFTPDTRYLNWTTTFPGVTLCEEIATKFALRKFSALYPDLLNSLNFDHKRYLADIVFARGECIGTQCGPCGTTVACDVPWRSIIEHVHKSCSELVSECSYNDVAFPCCEYFHQVDSDRGPCFSFNTLQHEGLNSLFVVNMTTGPGVLMFRLLADAELSIHSPEELSTNNHDVKLKHVIRPYSENRAELLFSVVEILNDVQLQRESVEDRGCRYLDEVPEDPLHTYPVYSYGACRLAESTKELYQRCGCVHPARDLTYENIFCNYTGINCWNAYEARKAKLGVDKSAKEDCVPSCVESELKTIHYRKRWVKDQPGEGTLVEVKMISLPTLRYQRNLLRDNLDLVVAVGGTVGLFFSASILSLLEVFYLLLRPPVNL
ncbi:hypothetical protein PYW07_014411 [Mythimna separata]|uniref:Uncharacterized protein n=1 Tax=Mythimna separata TaxID=271217 RepID=A0AAD7YZQ6_MYTSE|nr:hypothetical protein PYW07_014411 [Mythimna separata]